jgi:Protein of unknown function (DUF3300)
MAAIPIRVIVSVLVMVLGNLPVLSQPAPRSDAETAAPVATASPALPAPAAETPVSPSPTPAAETSAPTSPAPAAATETPAAPPPVPAAPLPTASIFRAEQLDRLLAPIALYPDALLAQILMAATYPLEIVKAGRWLQDARHVALQGDLLAGAVEAEAWDPSVKALAAFPQILRMMDANLDWTEQLGDAVLAQQGDVMDAIQRLRHQAAAAESLWSNAQQRVVTEGQGIVIEPANPGLIYPPVYPPAVYGAWPYPDYPPLDIEPADYGLDFAVPFGIGFGTGFVVVPSLVRRCAFDWGGRRILLGVDPPARIGPGTEPGAWQHDPAHRRGVPYLDLGSRQRFGVRPEPASLAAITRGSIPSMGAAAAAPRVLPAPGLRASAPAPRGPTTRAWIAPGAARRPIFSAQPAMQTMWRRSPISMMPHAFAPSRAPVAGGSFSFAGRSPRR